MNVHVILPRIDIDYGPKTRYHTCGTCKYVGVSEKDEPCINCINGVDMRKDLWQPKGE